jgi:hypothetical protein
MVNEFWKNDIFSDHGLLVGIRIPPVRRAIFRQLQNQKLFVLGSIFKYGLAYRGAITDSVINKKLWIIIANASRVRCN